MLKFSLDWISALWKKFNIYVPLINLVLFTLLAIGFYFGQDRVRIDIALQQIQELKTDVKDIRDLVIRHMERDK
jgi:hypothetical protein